MLCALTGAREPHTLSLLRSFTTKPYIFEFLAQNAVIANPLLMAAIVVMRDASRT